MIKQIRVEGAREHNLKNISLSIPRNKISVITGLSGSGKSSLAFDTIYAEGQRRYVESLSPYARQFLEKLKKPEVDHVSGLAPSISIEQKNFTKNPRSTVGTVTEIYDYMRLLFSKLGTQKCHQCGRKVSKQSPDEILKFLIKNFENQEVKLLAPLVRGRKGEFKKQMEDLKKRGFTKMRIDSEWRDTSKAPLLSKKKRHDLDVLIDHLLIKQNQKGRLTRSLDLALKESGGSLVILSKKKSKNEETFFSSKLFCVPCQISFPDLEPNHFSFNSPYGACPKCRGIGRISLLKQEEIIRNAERPLLGGAVNEDIYFSFNKYTIEDLVDKLHDHFHFDLKMPYSKLPQEVKDAFFWGTDEIEGLMDQLKQLYYSTSSEAIKNKIKRFLSEETCPKCLGSRLKPEVSGVKILDKNITEISQLSIEELEGLFKSIKFQKSQNVIASPILKEIKERIRFLSEVGLGYLSLNRSVSTLAGGELQRIKLASQIGVGLTGVLYVLDEPSIGLHPRDHGKLIHTLKDLRDLKNTIVVVEHDEETMRNADFLIDLGPAAGEKGGRVMASGAPGSVLKSRTLTADYLAGRKRIPVPFNRLSIAKRPALSLKGAEANNLKQIDVHFPLGTFICVTGVSGSGKSTLIHDTLFKALHNKIWNTHHAVGRHTALEGGETLDKVIEIDQMPIGRTPRSNAATYTDLFAHIRLIFSNSSEARLRGYSPGRFSFNVKSGRCEACQGAGYQKLEMSFLPDHYVLCEDCKGRRYNEATLEVQFKGKTIADVLEMSVSEAADFFSSFDKVKEKLEVMKEIGLGYLKLGQASTTLSGGEAQRIKLAAELSKRSTGKTLYILDEPTTGLHFADIQNLLKALFRLRDQGNTIVVIEHQLDVIKSADHLIDLGPEGGKEGGYLVDSGTPEKLAKNPRSYTGQFLKKALKMRST